MSLNSDPVGETQRCEKRERQADRAAEPDQVKEEAGSRVREGKAEGQQRRKKAGRRGELRKKKLGRNGATKK